MTAAINDPVLQPNLAGNADRIFPWSRFWVPADGRIQMGGFWDTTEGFLADPEDGLMGKGSNGHLLKTDALLTRQPGCLVLWGEPGMGKSQTLRSFLSSAPHADSISVEFRDIPDAGRFERVLIDSPIWARWMAGSDLLTVVIDGVDEGLIKIAGFVNYLRALLRDKPAARLQLVLACRSLEWPTSEGQELMHLWPANPTSGSNRSGIFELCPLRDKDARLAAGMVMRTESDSKMVNGFMGAVHRHQLFGLASRPLTLRMLLREFATSRRFSKSQRELYRRFSHFLCNEADPGRQSRLLNTTVPRPQVSPKARERMAGRIASLLQLCGRSAVWTGRAEDAAPSDLTIDEICQATEHLEGMELPVERHMVEAVLGSALFWAKGVGRIGFYHQTFADSLAAEYLRKLPFPQLRSLLCGRDQRGEFVHPPLSELASWVAAESEDFLEHLLRHDPETLLRSDVSDIKEAHRAELVMAVLRKAQAEELFDVRGLERFFHTLKHPGLAAQLRPVIADRKANQVVRRIALRMAERCALTDLFGDVFARVRDARDTGIHSLAAGALDDLTDLATARKLVKFIRRKRARPLAPGVALSLLHASLKHGAWSLGEALPYLPLAIQRQSASAPYILAQHAHPRDTEALLRACLHWPDCFDRLSPYHVLVSKAHDLGVARIHEPAIRRLLARVWWRARVKYAHDTFVPMDKEAPRLLDALKRDLPLRLAFIDDLASLASVRSADNCWHLFELADADDFTQFLKLAESGAPAKRGVYARLAGQVYDFNRHAPNWGLLVAAHQRSAEVRVAFPWMRTWPLDAAESLKVKHGYHESLRWQAKVNTKPRKKPKLDPVKVWARDLEHVGKGQPEDWLNLAHNLSYRGDEIGLADTTNADLRTSPGWKHHDEAARVLIMGGARRFVIEVQGNPHHQIGGQSDFDRLAYRGLFLLKDEIENSTKLAEAVRRHWLPTIFDEFSNGDEHHLQMMALAYRLDPVAVRSMVKAKLLKDAASEAGITIELRELTGCWDRPMAEFVVNVTATDITRPETVGYIMQHLAEHDADAGRQLWLRLQATRQQYPVRYAAGLSALASWRLFDFWNEIWPELEADPTLAENVLVGIDVHDQRSFLHRSTSLTEKRLADLYLLMREIFPPAKDPRVPTGEVYSPTHRMEISRLRDGLPDTLAAMGTDAATDELVRIAKILPAKEAIWMRWRLRDAVVTVRRKAWQPPTANFVVSLVQKANRRWLSDEADLLNLVQESLARLQDHLVRQPNLLRREYWKQHLGKIGDKYLVPCDEVDISRRIAFWLEKDLAKGRGITVQREVQIKWNNRTDIEVRTVTIAGDGLRPLEITVEVKGCWHQKVRTALKEQLVDEYLTGTGRTHGLYLVVWTTCTRWRAAEDRRRLRWKLKTLPETQAAVAQFATGYNGVASPFVVQTAVLDARLT